MDIARDHAWNSHAAAGTRLGLSRLALQGLLCAALLLGLGEGVARAVLTSPSRQVFDAELGFRYLPGSVFFDGTEGGAPLRLNALGLNDAEPAPKDARPRLAVVGDSMTMAYQVARSHNYVSRLQALRLDLDVVSIAMADMGPVEYQVMLSRFGAALAPDLVLFAFSTGDLADLRNAAPWVERGPDGTILRLHPAANDRQRMKRWIEPLVQRSALATHMMRRFGPMLARLSGGAQAAPEASPAGRLTEAEAEEIITFILRDAALHRPVAAVFLPQRSYGAGRRSTMDVTSAEEAALIARAAARAGVELHLPEAALAETYSRTGRPGHGFANLRIGSGHLNADGHAAVAAGLATFLPQVLPHTEDR